SCLRASGGRPTVPTRRSSDLTSSESSEVRRSLGLQESTYEGPTGIIGVLQHAALDRGMPAMSTWAAVPHYVAQPPSPKATLAIRSEEHTSELQSRENHVCLLL